MSHRFFLDSPPKTENVALEGDQAHHAIHVMRFKPGDEVVLFDGTGVEYRAEIDEVEKKRLRLNIIETIQQSRAVSTQITIAVALPKGDRQKFLIEKLVELGVARLIPLKTTRSVAVANEKVIQRLRKQVIEASKQCGRNTLMEIVEEQTLPELAGSLEHESSLKIIADPYQGRAIAELTKQTLDSIVVAVGPEGGFDEVETALANRSGFEPIRFGPAILRVETAALAAAAILGIGREA